MLSTEKCQYYKLFISSLFPQFLSKGQDCGFIINFHFQKTFWSSLPSNKQTNNKQKSNGIKFIKQLFSFYNVQNVSSYDRKNIHKYITNSGHYAPRTPDLICEQGLVPGRFPFSLISSLPKDSYTRNIRQLFMHLLTLRSSKLQMEFYFLIAEILLQSQYSKVQKHILNVSLHSTLSDNQPPIFFSLT